MRELRYKCRWCGVGVALNGEAVADSLEQAAATAVQTRKSQMRSAGLNTLLLRVQSTAAVVRGFCTVRCQTEAEADAKRGPKVDRQSPPNGGATIPQRPLGHFVPGGRKFEEKAQGESEETLARSAAGAVAAALVSSL